MSHVMLKYVVTYVCAHVVKESEKHQVSLED